MTVGDNPVPFSVCIITCNEESNIAGCLDSLEDLPDEVIVLDGGSQDRTCEIARLKGAIVHHHPFDCFGAQKQRAVDLAGNDWIFFLDADERMTPTLCHEISGLLTRPDLLTQHAAYRICRTNYFRSRPIRHGGWENDFLVRFFDRKKTSFDGKIVHEEAIVSGSIGTLKGTFDHFTVRTLDEFIRKNLLYAGMKARTKRPIGPIFRIVLMVLSPPAVFFRMYVLKLGFLDGLEGFILASLYGFFSFVKALYRPVPEEESQL